MCNNRERRSRKAGLIGRAFVALLAAFFLLVPAVALADESAWNGADEQTLSVMHTAFGIAATEKAILQMKLNALQEISADVSDRLTLLKGGVAKLNDEQTKRLADALAGLSKANAALDAENANIAAARKDYRTVRSQKDAKSVTQVLAELAGRYDAASNRANEVGSHLREVLGILKEAPVQMPVATTAPTPAASAAAEGESAK